METGNPHHQSTDQGKHNRSLEVWIRKSTLGTLEVPGWSRQRPAEMLTWEDSIAVVSCWDPYSPAFSELSKWSNCIFGRSPILLSKRNARFSPCACMSQREWAVLYCPRGSILSGSTSTADFGCVSLSQATVWQVPDSFAYLTLAKVSWSGSSVQIITIRIPEYSCSRCPWLVSIGSVCALKANLVCLYISFRHHCGLE